MGLIGVMAEVSVEAKDLGTWTAISMGVVGGVVAIAAGIKSLFGPAEVPQPLEVQGRTRMATHDELAATAERCEECREHFRTEITELRRALEKLSDGTKEDAERRAGKLHARIDAVVASVATVQGELKHMTTAIHDLTQAINGRHP